MLSERLKSLRLESKITQKEISDKLEIGQGTYARYEKGDRKPTGEILNKLANFFNVSTDYLLGNTDNKNSTKFEDDLEESLNTARAFSGKPISDHDR